MRPAPVQEFRLLWHVLGVTRTRLARAGGKKEVLRLFLLSLSNGELLLLNVSALAQDTYYVVQDIETKK